MKKSDLARIFLRSLLIQSSLNFRRMQNLGFAYAVAPLARSVSGSDDGVRAFLLRHLQVFNTHPYLVSAIVGSVVRVEEDWPEGGGQEAEKLKKAFMGPYAAIGDTFFWGTFRPFASIVAVVAAMMGVAWAPFLFALLYMPLQLWIRSKGFLEGYRLGVQGFEYIRGLDLPAMNGRIRWASLSVLALFAAWWLESAAPAGGDRIPAPVLMIAMPMFTLFCLGAIKMHVPPLAILYGSALILFLLLV